jgi:hypothetical protein
VQSLDCTTFYSRYQKSGAEKTGLRRSDRLEST